MLCLSGEFDEELAGKRMKLPIPETWETQVSMKGNKAVVWQSLIGQLPTQSLGDLCDVSASRLLSRPRQCIN